MRDVLLTTTEKRRQPLNSAAVKSLQNAKHMKTTSSLAATQPLLPQPNPVMNIKCLRSVLLLIAAHIAAAHNAHNHESADNDETSSLPYAQKHMQTEHHIDTFDVQSFFHIHDLNRDGFWDKEEIEAVYGVHHVYSQKASADEVAHAEKAEHIVKVILDAMDADKDGRISPEELEVKGIAGLPDFNDLGAEGHHYDVESEFYLHHEEEFHSTPETQKDDAYTHAEDVEHFAQHERIEDEETAKEASYEGVSVEELVSAQEQAFQEHESHEAPAQSGGEEQQAPLVQQEKQERPDPVEKFRNARQASGAHDDEWGTGSGGYSTPQSPSDKMRKNLPYKYKFRRSWGDF